MRETKSCTLRKKYLFPGTTNDYKLFAMFLNLNKYHFQNKIFKGKYQTI